MESRKRTEALNRLELILAKEHELESIGLQAAAAAHSLGTPLSTITVVVKELEKEGKKVPLFALKDITNDRLNNLRGIDAFIQVACPRISTDNQFDKPVLSTPQANALLKVLRKENIDEYLEIPHWL